MDGKIKHEVQVPVTFGFLISINVVFNHVNKTIFVSLSVNWASLFIFSKTGELLYDFEIPGWCFQQLTSHPNGRIAIVDGDKVMMLHM